MIWKKLSFFQEWGSKKTYKIDAIVDTWRVAYSDG
jgi:hypothetical protein